MARKRLTEEEKQARAAAAAAKKEAEREEAERLHKRKTIRDEIWAILILALGVFLALSIFTNTTGQVGRVTEAFLGGLLGKVVYVLPFFLVVFGVLIFARRTAYLTWRTLVCSMAFFLLLTCLFARYTDPLKSMIEAKNLTTVTFAQLKEVYLQGTDGGGWIGVLLANILLKALGTTGLWIVTLVGMLISLVFLMDTPVSALFDNMRIKRAARKKVKEEQAAVQDTPAETPPIEGEKTEDIPAVQPPAAAEASEAKKTYTENTIAPLDLTPLSLIDDAKYQSAEKAESAEELIEEIPELPTGPFNSDKYSENQKKILEYMGDDTLFGNTEKPQTRGLSGADGKIGAADVAGVKNGVISDIEKSKLAKSPLKYKFPPLEFLKKGSARSSGKDLNLNEMKKTLEKTLQSFGVDARVIDVTKGPAVTRFEVQPAPGVKVSSISKLHDDLALNLMAKSLRIEAPIPGKAAVGIEVSNPNVSIVTLREVLESREFRQAESKITVAVGKSISGEPIVCDIKDMPHLLIAGSTGSGKSVCINSMLISLLYKSTPEEVRLILVDPKVVELSGYNGIPHLLIPVVTEPAKASAALGWAVSEMNERYVKFAEEGVRDLAGYNDYVRANGEPDKFMPQIVIVIDELHDLMLSARNTVEDNIARLAAKARAAGMHLIVATQRPSVDVITGVIKNNIPSRIAFAVGNAMDSRTILDEGGAENLLGKGDMLYAPQSFSKPLRVQGCFISDSEVSAVIDFVKTSNAAAEYSDTVQDIIAKATAPISERQNSDEEEEELKQAIEYVVRAQECSVSMLQRRFRIGYNRAARLVEAMEERGIIGPADGARKRKVNLSLEEWMASDPANTEIPEEIN